MVYNTAVVGYVMDTVFLVLRVCEDNGCSSLPPRGAVALIACFGLLVCAVDLLTKESQESLQQCVPQEVLQSMKQLLATLFTMANLLLLLASIVESPFLVRLYVCYTMCFSVLGLVMCIGEFLLRVQRDGVASGCTVLAVEAAYLFMIFRCLPLVDTYGRHLNGMTSITS